MGPSERFFICGSGQRSLQTILGASFYGQQHARLKIPVTVQRLEWSINGLATEFGLDRQTVVRRPRTVRPVSEKRGTRLEKKRLLKHAASALQPRSQDKVDESDAAFTARLEAETIDVIKRWAMQTMLPHLLDSATFASLLTGYLRVTHGYSKRDCVLAPIVWRLPCGGRWLKA
jgi:hypothetical protein